MLDVRAGEIQSGLKYVRGVSCRALSRTKRVPNIGEPPRRVHKRKLKMLTDLDAGSLGVLDSAAR